jgi:hypothetical protein
MGIHRLTAEPRSTQFETVDRGKWTHRRIPHRYIHIACITDISIKSTKARFLGVQHA